MTIQKAIEGKDCRKCGTLILKSSKLSATQWGKKKFCSQVCQRQGRDMSGFGYHRLGKKFAVPRKCEECAEVSEFVSSYKEWNKLLCRRHYQQYRLHGKVLWDERPCVTPKAKRDRSLLVQIEWRKAVFGRDNYTCQGCGERGGKLQADHINPYSLYPELRAVLSNGRTLCVPCHKKTPTYGRRVDKLARALASGIITEQYFDTL